MASAGHVTAASGEAWAHALRPGDGGEWSIATATGVVDVQLHGAVLARMARGDRLVLDGSSGGVGPSRRRRQPDPRGRLTALRRARVAPAGPGAVAFDVVLSPEAADAGGFPFAVVVTAGLTGAGAAFFFSPIFALLAGVSAVAVIGRWVAAHVARWRNRKKRAAETAEHVRAWVRRSGEWVRNEADARRSSTFSPDQLVEAGGDEGSPWWERLEPGGVLSVAVGTGDLLVDVPVEGSMELDGLAVSRRAELTGVPVDVAFEPGLALCGDRSEVLASARWLLCSILARIGPADLRVVLVTTADRVADWDGLKWSPSLEACIVVDDDREDALADVLQSCATERRPVLVVVDGAEPTGSGVLARVLSGRVDHTRLLWLGAVGDVPAGCCSSLVVAADGSARLERLDVGAQSSDRPVVRWFGRSAEQWETAMRWLGRYEDPECEDVGSSLPSTAALADVVAGASSGELTRVDGDRRWAAALHQRWANATMERLVAPIGVDRDGVVAIDLVADGPHVLAAGTTGAGKSELLRTLVVGLASEQPPEVVSFVLIDFKGGGAFDLVAPLPHVGAVVTDLDPAEASRALRGLRAEILDREHRLRDMEVIDVGDVDRTHPRAFGRMVVMVDEFAALAEELPEFLDGLVDIARRGRSLGVHLVLATQRPSGIVNGQIRANSNLRLCLRVQDRGDSIDVIDDPVAGQLPSIPGRLVMRRGGEPCQQLQVAQVSGRQAGPAVDVFRLHPSVPVSDEQRAAVALVAASLRSLGGTDIDEVSLVERIVVAGRGGAPAKAPWTDMPERVDFPVVCDSSGGAAIGVLDDPDRRVVRPMCWQPTADGLWVIGADEQQIASTAATAVAAAIGGGEFVPVFVLDGERGGSSVLRELLGLDPVIDVIGSDEPERLGRAVEQLERTTEPRLVVIHQWAALVDALNDLAGPLGAEQLIKLVRRAGTPGTGIVVTARSERDVPQRAASALGARVIHRMADPAGFVSFGLRPADFASLDGGCFAEPSSGLMGVVAGLDSAAIATLGQRLAGIDGVEWPEPIRVLGSHVHRAVLPPAEDVGGGFRVPVGLDIDLSPYWVTVGRQRPVVVLGHPGGGRTTAIDTISNQLGDRVCVIDDVEGRPDDEVAALIADATACGRPIVAGCTPAQAKRFGSAITELMATGTVVLLNPSRHDGEVVRMAVPDLTDQPKGRAVAVERGRATVVQIAA